MSDQPQYLASASLATMLPSWTILQVLVIEFVAFAIEFVTLAIEFVYLAIEFVPLAIEFVTLARKFVMTE